MPLNIDIIAKGADGEKVSPAMDLMIRRKKLMRRLSEMDDQDNEKAQTLRKQANDLYAQAQRAGGLTVEEAQVLALAH